MPSMTQCKCKNCKEPFMARTADVKRGWGKFCSKSCKAIKQEQRTGQHADHMFRQNIIAVNGKTLRELQQEFGGTPEFDRHGRYVGFRDGGFDNTQHQNHDEN